MWRAGGSLSLLGDGHDAPRLKQGVPVWMVVGPADKGSTCTSLVPGSPSLQLPCVSALPGSFLKLPPGRSRPAAPENLLPQRKPCGNCGSNQQEQWHRRSTRRDHSRLSRSYPPQDLDVPVSGGILGVVAVVVSLSSLRCNCWCCSRNAVFRSRSQYAPRPDRSIPHPSTCPRHLGRHNLPRQSRLRVGNCACSAPLKTVVPTEVAAVAPAVAVLRRARRFLDWPGPPAEQVAPVPIRLPRASSKCWGWEVAGAMPSIG